MNLLIKLILILAAGVLINFSNAQEKSYNLSVQTNADSASLFIDDVYFGSSKNFDLKLDEGIHILQIFENVKEWNSETFIDTIVFNQTKNISRTYNFSSKIELKTDPEDVRVYEKDSLVGFTPLLLESGFTELNLKKPDYSNLQVTSEEISGNDIPKLKYIGEPPKKEFYGSLLFNVLLGTAIALGAATAYYKLEADDLYDKYLITGDPGIIDNIEYYDGQSAGTLIGMEICLGAIIYFFLTE